MQISLSLRKTGNGVPRLLASSVLTNTAGRQFPMISLYGLFRCVSSRCCGEVPADALKKAGEDIKISSPKAPQGKDNRTQQIVDRRLWISTLLPPVCSPWHASRSIVEVESWLSWLVLRWSQQMKLDERLRRVFSFQ